PARTRDHLTLIGCCLLSQDLPANLIPDLERAVAEASHEVLAGCDVVKARKFCAYRGLPKLRSRDLICRIDDVAEAIERLLAIAGWIAAHVEPAVKSFKLLGRSIIPRPNLTGLAAIILGGLLRLRLKIAQADDHFTLGVKRI